MRGCAVKIIFTLFIGMFCVSHADDVNWSSATIIDVRTQEEWDSGHIEGAIHIPWRQIEQGIVALNIDSSQPLGFYCARGARAELAIRKLKKLGFTDTHNLINVRKTAEVTGRAIVQ